MSMTITVKNDQSYLFAEKVIDRGYVGQAGKNKREIAGAITKEEAKALALIIRENNCQKSLETGVANGISTLAITQAIAENNGHHYGIDPCQLDEHQGVALDTLEEYGLKSSFTLLNGPSHLELPKLIESSEKVDFVFIDGMHKFDYKFIDFFLSDQLLQVGGFLAFHDMVFPSTKKVYRIIQRSYQYRLCQTNYASPDLLHKTRSVAGALLRGKPYWYSWPNDFRNLLVLQKVAHTDHPWHYFKNF